VPAPLLVFPGRVNSPPALASPFSPTAAARLRSRIHAHPIRRRAPAGSPLAERFDLVPRSDGHGDHVLGGGTGESLPGGAARRRPEDCDAKCDAAGSRIERRGAAENDRTGCHHSGCSGFFGPGIARQDARGA